MGQAERQYGKDVTVLTVGSLNLLGRFVSMTISTQEETADNRACWDIATYPLSIGESCEITLEEAMESSTYDTLLAAVGTSVVLAYTACSTGVAHSMTVLIASGEHAIRREGQNITIRAMRQGAASS